MSIAILPLVAESSALVDFLTKLVEFSPAGGTRLGMLAAGLAVGVLVAWNYSRRRTRRATDASPHQPQKLFRELCQAHGLSAAQRRLLEWLVADRELMLPALVFLDPILLESAIGHGESPGVRKRLTELRTKFFGGLEREGKAGAAQT
jgi:hypothetical protein